MPVAAAICSPTPMKSRSFGCRSRVCTIWWLDTPAPHRRREIPHRPGGQWTVGRVPLQILGGPLRSYGLDPAAHDVSRPLILAAGVGGVLIIAGPGRGMRLTHPPADY